ncbi:PREDICTED: zinc finger protein CONSTANS-LIKE 2-like isoform X2 [Ipomoea nil]|uniref:zinc finger protein CONSTANS-LIKE 2-like isoform X2 n=1 Tax=Ipomoea nil TaxID=35883 RepID=UPI000901B250|nr:PREDICTED: zinc finger protein CONSTANS-LIKE 2-like isoform X2 [Ipomoea nil]
MKKSCELCQGIAKTFCESDQAHLCWNCDAKVHSANFLVERHSRLLLCNVCHSPTSWSASGAKLGFAVSLCGSCVADTGRRRRQEAEESQGESRVDEPGYEDDNDDDDDEDDEEEDEISDSEDIQVVPWSSTPPPSISSSSSEDSSHGGEEGEVFLKRLRETNPDPFSDDDRGSSLLGENSCKLPPPAFAGSLSNGMTRPMKIRKREDSQMGRFV